MTIDELKAMAKALNINWRSFLNGIAKVNVSLPDHVYGDGTWIETAALLLGALDKDAVRVSIRTWIDNSTPNKVSGLAHVPKCSSECGLAVTCEGKTFSIKCAMGWQNAIGRPGPNCPAVKMPLGPDEEYYIGKREKR